MTNISLNKLFAFIMLAAAGIGMVACSDSKSYSELLSDENHCVNAFLAEHRVVDGIPADSVFEVGVDAPYYAIDEDRNVYMQVLEKGDDERAQKDDKVYFRYIRYNLQNYVVGSDDNVGAGNAIDMTSQATFFLFENQSVNESVQYGDGIQMPMKFLGYNCKVNLVVKSQAGPATDMGYVVPYLYTISYYKPAL